jgi:hypothetical protein
LSDLRDIHVKSCLIIHLEGVSKNCGNRTRPLGKLLAKVNSDILAKKAELKARISRQPERHESIVARVVTATATNIPVPRAGPVILDDDLKPGRQSDA